VDRWRELSLPWRIASALALGVMGLAIYDVLGRELYMKFMATSAISVCAIVIALSLARLRSRALA
jgi:hypothetical protein